MRPNLRFRDNACCRKYVSPMADTNPQSMMVIHKGIMRMEILVASTSVTLHSFHLCCVCSSRVCCGRMIAALSRHLQ